VYSVGIFKNPVTWPGLTQVGFHFTQCHSMLITINYGKSYVSSFFQSLSFLTYLSLCKELTTSTAILCPQLGRTAITAYLDRYHMYFIRKFNFVQLISEQLNTQFTIKQISFVVLYFKFDDLINPTLTKTQLSVVIYSSSTLSSRIRSPPTHTRPPNFRVIIPIHPRRRRPLLI